MTQPLSFVNTSGNLIAVGTFEGTQVQLPAVLNVDETDKPQPNVPVQPPVLTIPTP